MPARRQTRQPQQPAQAFSPVADDVPTTVDDDMPPEVSVAESDMETLAGDNTLGSIDLLAGMNETHEDLMGGEPKIIAADVEVESWRQQTPLEEATPKCRPGYVQQWIRITDSHNMPDVENKLDAFKNRGWRPRDASTLGDDDSSPVFSTPQGGGVIVWKGQLLLCERREELHKQQTQRLNAEADAINRVIYNETEKESGLPGKYASVSVGRPADLVD